MHSTTSKPVTGFFRSEIYYKGAYYDTTWRQYAMKAAPYYEIIVKECLVLESRVSCLHEFIENADFHRVLANRGNAIRNANLSNP